MTALEDSGAKASHTGDFRPPLLEEKKVREVLDSLLQESDLRSCQIAFPAEMEAETRAEQDPIDDPDDEETRVRDRTRIDAPQDEDDDMKPMGPHLDDQAEQESELLDSMKM